MWALALVLILVWLLASVVVWIVEAVVACRRKAPLPTLRVSRGMSDAKFGRTAGAAAAIVVVLALIGGNGSHSASSSVRAEAATVDRSVPARRDSGAPANSSKREARAERNARAERKARAERSRKRRAARRRTDKAAAAPSATQRTTRSNGKCDPSYTGACLDPDASDYDCQGGTGDGPKYTGTVTVVGNDHFDLDRDGDGTGCDS
jgi:hypothetical protein